LRSGLDGHLCLWATPQSSQNPKFLIEIMNVFYQFEIFYWRGRNTWFLVLNHWVYLPHGHNRAKILNFPIHIGLSLSEILNWWRPNPRIQIFSTCATWQSNYWHDLLGLSRQITYFNLLRGWFVRPMSSTLFLLKETNSSTTRESNPGPVVWPQHQ
jgi:hypothetical protein